MSRFMLEVLDVMLVVLMSAMFMSFILLCAWMYPPMTVVKKMDCALAEFSPDISAEIKQLCREARSKK